MMELRKRLSPMSIRKVCIENCYYTSGDVDAYNKLLFEFELADITVEHLVMLAEDIKDHSNTEDDVFTIVNKLAFEVQCFVVSND